METLRKELKRVCECGRTFFTRHEDFSCRICRVAKYNEYWRGSVMVLRNTAIKHTIKDILNEDDSDYIWF